MPVSNKVHVQKDEVNAQRVMDRIEQLATFSSMEGMVTRAYLTDEHKAAHHQLGAWMEEAGLQTWQDEVGNQWGRLLSSNPTEGTVIIGSHSDTVVNAGKYDGTLGVIMAIEALSNLKLNNIELPFHVDVVAFADEEGTRFNTTLLGSCGVAGTWNPDWLDIKDASGISIGQAMKAFGLDINAIPEASRAGDKTKAYLEVHIEQGPVLESCGLPVGVVTGIAGAKRFIVDVSGMAGHAGTVPLELRNDALCAAAEMITTIEAYAKAQGIVATVGKCDIKGGAVNVIPGKVQFSIDIRSQNQELLENSCTQLLMRLQSIAQKRQVTAEAEKIYEASAVTCDSKLQSLWSSVTEDVTRKPVHLLPSGAGHDAMMMATIAPMSMLFLRCEKGISHNPLEDVLTEDVAVGLTCLEKMITAL
ncbi:allantoate amidohydrolase [Vibrio albus]|uniref:Allantoate amidohydrolase n=1 Tax=Vibrio albus TaxID=2200953 RepID=A0A2U3B6F6_9VIBR|nr:allantoate amidohydrolase [Vibrio albus]PWI32370.1 allantoate amidohydrolase [Vibrio albus]